MIASASVDGTIRFWQPTIGRMVRFLRCPSRPLALAWSPTGDRLFASTESGDVLAIDPDEAKIVAQYSGVKSWAYSLAVSRTGKHVFVAGKGGMKSQLDISEQK